MNNLSIKRLFVFFLIFSFVCSVGEAQDFKKSFRNPEREVFGKSLNNKKEVKIREPRSVTKAKRKQEANDKKLKKEYAAFVRKSRKHNIEIQTPEVQARMKENRKDADSRYKAKKKKTSESTKKAGIKYRK